MSESANPDHKDQHVGLDDKESEAEALHDEDFQNVYSDGVSNACTNCGSNLNGHFCAICGQPNKEIRRPFYVLLAEIIHVLLDLDGRAYRSVLFLFTRPAYLSKAYINGQRANYTAPLRLFLAVSITFFIFMTVQNGFQSLRDSMNQIEAEQTLDATTASETPSAPAEDDEDDGIDPEDVEWLYELIDRINVPFVSEQTNQSLHAVMRQQAEENLIAVMEDPAESAFNLLEYITIFILLMIPILAFMQFVLFFLARRYFIEHLVLTLHNHTFIVLAFLLLSLFGIFEASGNMIVSGIAGFLNTLIVIWIPVYLLLSLKFFFGWGWWITAFLFIVTSIAYAIAMSIGIGAFALTMFLLS
jgi:hypothetical protein